jgi:hypothetical protein
LRDRSISLCVDLVLNHTAKGDLKYQIYYLMFESPEQPNRFEETPTEVFPDTAPGTFAHLAHLRFAGGAGKGFGRRRCRRGRSGGATHPDGPRADIPERSFVQESGRGCR